MRVNTNNYIFPFYSSLINQNEEVSCQSKQDRKRERPFFFIKLKEIKEKKF